MREVKEKSIIDRCTAQVYREFIRNGYLGVVPTLQDFHAALLEQPDPAARDVALALELFTEGSLNTFAKYTNVDTNSRILCYDIRDLGKQLLPELLKGSIRAAAECCLRRGVEGFDSSLFQR